MDNRWRTDAILNSQRCLEEKMLNYNSLHVNTSMKFGTAVYCGNSDKKPSCRWIADRTASQHFWCHVTSSVTWPFDSPYVVFYWWSFGTKQLSL